MLGCGIEHAGQIPGTGCHTKRHANTWMGGLIPLMEGLVIRVLLSEKRESW